MKKKILIIALLGIFLALNWACSKEDENQSTSTNTGYRVINEGDPGWGEFE